MKETDHFEQMSHDKVCALLESPIRLIATLESSTKATSARQVGLRKGEIQAGSSVRRVSYHRRTLVLIHTKQPLALKRR